jgi:hypothetical protein
MCDLFCDIRDLVALVTPWTRPSLRVSLSSMSSLRTQVADWLGGADDSEDLVNECTISLKSGRKAP